MNAMWTQRVETFVLKPECLDICVANTCIANTCINDIYANDTSTETYDIKTLMSRHKCFDNL